MKSLSSLILLISLVLTAGLQIRLSHDNKKGYSYTISGPSPEEVQEADQKLRQYLRSLAPKKIPAPTPSSAAPKTAPVKK